MNRTQALYKEAKRLIPGGTQLLSKRPEQLAPDLWPAYYERAKGCEVWDVDGKKYIDMSYMGIGSCVLGYADKDVDEAVKLAVRKGSMSTLNSPEEVELAKLLIRLHPWAGMARFARTGGEAMAIAVRIARAASGKDIAIFSGYHGWHDWYLAANLSSNRALDGHHLPGLNPLGVPRKLRGTAYPFKYNDTEEFRSLINRHKDKIGVVVLESIRNVYPEREFIKTIRAITKRLGIVLVVDEVSAGFRMNPGGAHLLLGLEPDIAVFAKGMSNGFPMAAIIGTKKVMAMAQDTFISSTYWTDRVGPAAALATIRKFKEKKVHEHLIDVGKMVQDGWRNISLKHKVEIDISGIYPLSHFSFKHKEPLVLKTLYTQLMLRKGFLATNAFYASYAHKREHVDGYLQATGDAFKTMAIAIESGKPATYLKGPVCHSGFKRLA